MKTQSNLVFGFHENSDDGFSLGCALECNFCATMDSLTSLGPRLCTCISLLYDDGFSCVSRFVHLDPTSVRRWILSRLSDLGCALVYHFCTTMDSLASLGLCTWINFYSKVFIQMESPVLPVNLLLL